MLRWATKYHANELVLSNVSRNVVSSWWLRCRWCNQLRICVSLSDEWSRAISMILTVLFIKMANTSYLSLFRHYHFTVFYGCLVNKLIKYASTSNKFITPFHTRESDTSSRSSIIKGTIGKKNINTIYAMIDFSSKLFLDVMFLLIFFYHA